MIHHMKSIAVTIEEPMLAQIDRLTERGVGKSRSDIVRHALRLFLDAQERRLREEEEGAILARNRDELAREARALIAEQAKP